MPDRDRNDRSPAQVPDAAGPGARRPADVPPGRKRPPARDRDWTGHQARYRDDDQTWVVGLVEADDGRRITLRDDRGESRAVDRARCEALPPLPPMPDPHAGDPDFTLVIPAEAARPIRRWLERGEAKGRALSEVLWRSVTPTGVDGLWFVLTCFNKHSDEESRASLTLVVFRESDGLNTSACEPLYEPDGRRLLRVAGVRKLVEVRAED